MDIYSDIELVELSVAGGAEAFEYLVKRHYLTVYKVSYKWCGVREDAEDIAQEVFVKLARKLKTFGRKSSFRTWLYRITVNTAKDFCRKAGTKRAYETAFAAERSQDNPGSQEDERLDAARLYKSLDKLPEKQKYQPDDGRRYDRKPPGCFAVRRPLFPGEFFRQKKDSRNLWSMRYD